MNRQNELAAQYVGREWPCDLEGDWAGYYPVVSEGRIVAVYDSANQDPVEYTKRPIVDDMYIDADAPDEIEDGLYDTSDAARLLGINERRVRALCAEGRMGQQVGGTWVIDAADLRANQERKPGRPRTTRDLLVKLTEGVSLAAPGAPLGVTPSGARIYRITSVPLGVDDAEVVRVVRLTGIWLPEGPWEIPWTRCGEGKIVTKR